MEIATFFFSPLNPAVVLDGEEPWEEREDSADCNRGLVGDAGFSGEDVDG